MLRKSDLRRTCALAAFALLAFSGRLLLADEEEKRSDQPIERIAPDPAPSGGASDVRKDGVQLERVRPRRRVREPRPEMRDPDVERRNRDWKENAPPVRDPDAERARTERRVFPPPPHDPDAERPGDVIMERRQVREEAPVEDRPERDLVVRRFSVRKDRLHPREQTVMEAVVYNRSREVAEGVLVRFFVEQRQVGEDYLLEIGPFAEAKIAAPFEVEDVGHHALFVRVDPENEIPEEDKGNNVRDMVVEAVPRSIAQLDEGPKAAGPKTAPAEEITDGNGMQPWTAPLPAPDLTGKPWVWPGGVYYGDGTCIHVTVRNDGTAQAGPFTVGFCLEKKAGTNLKSKNPEWLGTAKVTSAMNPGDSRLVTIPWQVLLVGTIDKLVTVVDIEDVVDEGTAGEKNNISDPFTFANVQGVEIKNLSVSHTCLMPGECPTISADVDGEIMWHVHYLSPNSELTYPMKNPVDGQLGLFPSTPLTLSKPVWPLSGTASGYGDKAWIVLTAVNLTQTVWAQKYVEVTRAKALDGALSIQSVNYVWDKAGQKVTFVTITLKAKTNSPFELGNHGDPAFGSMLVVPYINSKKWMYVPNKGWTVLDHIVSGDTYSVKGGGGGKTLQYPNGLLTPTNGECIFTVSLKPECIETVQGAEKWQQSSGGPFQPGKLECVQTWNPDLTVVIHAYTTSGKVVLKTTVSISEADREKKFF